MTVLVTVVGRIGRADLELADDRPVRELVAALAAAVGEHLATGLRDADGRPLDPEASLADAGVLDGHRLTLTSSPTELPSSPLTEPPLASTPPGFSASVRDLALYLLIDTSDSMAGPPLAAVTTELGRLFDAVRNHPRLTALCRLSVVGFDDEARLQVPLTPVCGLGPSPLLTATRPTTNYATAFDFLRRQISRDLDGLRVAGRRPARPVAVVYTDGHPTRGSWRPAHRALTDSSWPDAPDVVVLGFGHVSERVLRSIATSGTHRPAPASGMPPSGPAGALAGVMRVVLGRLEGAPSEIDQTAAPSQWRSLDEVLR